MQNVLQESFESGLIYGSAWMSVLWSQEKLLYLHVMVSYYIKRSHKSNTKNDTNVYDGCLSKLGVEIDRFQHKIFNLWKQ